MPISYQTDGVRMPDIRRKDTSEWIKSVAKEYGKAIDEIAYIFCSDEKILEINQHYLQHDYYTDIITFDYSESNRLSGDIFISLDTVRSNAAAFGTNIRQELHRVLIHGILHLCGLKDKTTAERARMEQAENEALALISTRLLR
ncbi:MAG: rRNA maturation RNase YbeY [Prevotellaceae bacterium]|jgi:rRNA maturation RNase YbeY|nr:rRNA maturation RNase YbeY [Prevotellaceae bacterium]